MKTPTAGQLGVGVMAGSKLMGMTTPSAGASKYMGMGVMTPNAAGLNKLNK